MGGYPSVLVGSVSVCHFKINERTYSRPRLRESTYHLGQTYTNKNDNSSADNFTKVEKRRRSTRIGRMKQPDLKVVEKPVNIFVLRFHPDVLESEIKQFAQTRFKSASTVIVEKLKTKFDSYSSFKISIAVVPAKECLDLKQWPTGILVKKIFNTSKSKNMASFSKFIDNSNGDNK